MHEYEYHINLKKCDCERRRKPEYEMKTSLEAHPPIEKKNYYISKTTVKRNIGSLLENDT